MDFPNDDSGQVLTEMHQAGINLTIKHEVVFFHLFEKEMQAQAMADFIKQSMPDVTVIVHADETPNVWDVDCAYTMIPSYEAVVNKENEFEAIATKFSGYSDGWGIEG